MLLLGNQLGWLTSSVIYSTYQFRSAQQCKFTPQRGHRQVEDWVLGPLLHSRSLEVSSSHLALITIYIFTTANLSPAWTSLLNSRFIQPVCLTYFKLNMPETALPIFPPKLLNSVNGNSIVLFFWTKRNPVI